MSEKPSVSRVRPWNEGGHAVYRAAFAVEFHPKPPPQTIRELIALHPQVKSDHPRKQETQSIALKVENGIPEVGATELPTLSGFIFDSLKPDGQLSHAIRLDSIGPPEGSSTTLSVLRADYESWEATWDQKARPIFDLMLSTLLEKTSAVRFQLQFHDRFVWEGDQEDFSPEQLFRKGSEFLVKNVFDSSCLWHSHHGYFEYFQEPFPYRILNVAEVQLTTLDPNESSADLQLVADLKLTHNIHHGIASRSNNQIQPLGKEVLLNADHDSNLLDFYMNTMHDKNKWLLARLVNDEVCDAIGLERPN